MSQVIDMTGQRFGRLTVIEKLPTDPNAKCAIWRCVCDCGNERVVRGTALRSGEYKSCGCLSGAMKLQYIKNDPDWKKNKSDKNIPCPYNEGCHCRSKDCWKCGWNPKVAQARKKAFEAGRRW